jgi:hypothetical protein
LYTKIKIKRKIVNEFATFFYFIFHTQSQKFSIVKNVVVVVVGFVIQVNHANARAVNEIS